MAELKATVLIDNLSDGELTHEWGLAVHIDYKGTQILLDTGATGAFVGNAPKLGVDLEQVQFGVLSHAHFDHSDGLDAFFSVNRTAPFYLRKGAQENCYGRKWIFSRYIGIKRGTLEKYADRIRFAEGDQEICPGVTLVPHRTPNLSAVGKRAGMYRKVNGRWQADDFSHEQSLVLETEQGLVIFNSCSHGGADNIIREVAAAFPGKKIGAILGGFHLFESSREQVLTLAKGIRDTGIETVVTGHCTGEKAYGLLKDKLGEKLHQLKTGFVFEV